TKILPWKVSPATSFNWATHRGEFCAYIQASFVSRTRRVSHPEFHFGWAKLQRGRPSCRERCPIFGWKSRRLWQGRSAVATGRRSAPYLSALLLSGSVTNCVCLRALLSKLERTSRTFTVR